MRKWIIRGGLVVFTLVFSAGLAQAAVHVNIGINVPAPPQLVAVPGAPVAYAPAVPANYFSYAGRYYVFAYGVWYVSPGYNGPWVVLAPEYVPAPLLTVPVRYYHAPPVAWRQWRREEPPRWDGRWGRHWEDGRGDHRHTGREEHRGDRGEHRGERHREHHEERGER
jgi:hypothetical protein